MNPFIDEETGVNPREEYLGKCVCHHSAVSPMDKQQYPFTLLHLHSLPDIYVFGIGAEIYDSDLKPLTAGTGGSHFFKMQDITNLQETFDEIIGILSPRLSLPLLE